MTINNVPVMTRAFVAAVAALLVAAPTANADPQDGSQRCPDQTDTSGQGTDQQCQGQGNPAGKAADQAQKQLQQQQDPNKKPISQVGFMYIVNGVPTCIHNTDVLVGGTAVPVTPVQAC